MIASNNTPTGPSTPILQWEDDGGAIPSLANLRHSSPQINVGNTERIVSAIAGGALLVHGVSSRSLNGLVTAILGGGLLYRGLTGHCQLYQALDMSTADGPNSSAMSCCATDSSCSRDTMSRPTSVDLAGESQAAHMSNPSQSPVANPPAPRAATGAATPMRVPDRRAEGTPGSPPPGRT